LSKKCAIERRSYAPGQFGQARIKVKEYGVQLREKQKVKRIYGVLEKQFRIYFAKADRKKGVTGENLLTTLETRLDSVVVNGGLAASRAQARQLIRHNHIQVNGRKVNIPSFLVKKGDEIQVRAKSRKNDVFAIAVDRSVEALEWLSLDKDALKIVVQSLPIREQVRMPIQEQLIVELYSK
jgi:small subunit ribosomal protein S4